MKTISSSPIFLLAFADSCPRSLALSLCKRILKKIAANFSDGRIVLTDRSSMRRVHPSLKDSPGCAHTKQSR
jgi:hypothetical protein